MLQEECKEKILSEEYRDFMMRDTGALGKNFPLENGCRIPLKYGFELFYIDQSEDRKKSLADYPYTMVPKCYTTLDMAAIQQAGIAAVQNIPGLELSGEGVLVGIIDTGINYLDPIFRNLDGRCTYKSCDKFIYRMIVNVLRGIYLLDQTVFHDNDFCPKRHCFCLIVCNINDGGI